MNNPTYQIRVSPELLDKLRSEGTQAVRKHLESHYLGAGALSHHALVNDGRGMAERPVFIHPTTGEQVETKRITTQDSVITTKQDKPKAERKAKADPAMITTNDSVLGKPVPSDRIAEMVRKQAAKREAEDKARRDAEELKRKRLDGLA